MNKIHEIILEAFDFQQIFNKKRNYLIMLKNSMIHKNDVIILRELNSSEYRFQLITDILKDHVGLKSGYMIISIIPY